MWKTAVLRTSFQHCAFGREKLTVWRWALLYATYEDFSTKAVERLESCLRSFLIYARLFNQTAEIILAQPPFITDWVMWTDTMYLLRADHLTVLLDPLQAALHSDDEGIRISEKNAITTGLWQRKSKTGERVSPTREPSIFSIPIRIPSFTFALTRSLRVPLFHLVHTAIDAFFT